MTTMTGEFEVSSWNEDTYEEIDDGRKLTRAHVEQNFRGDLQGTGTVEWLMCYGDDGTARFVGLQRIESPEGTLVIESIGDFDGQKALGNWTVVPGSGTGEFAGMAGEGSFEAPMGGTPSYRLESQS
jgi:hypothetical protein